MRAKDIGPAPIVAMVLLGFAGLMVKDILPGVFAAVEVINKLGMCFLAALIAVDAFRVPLWRVLPAFLSGLWFATWPLLDYHAVLLHGSYALLVQDPNYVPPIVWFNSWDFKLSPILVLLGIGYVIPHVAVSIVRMLREETTTGPRA